MILPDAEATEAAGRALAANLRSGDVIALSGNLGAGKTCFARGVLFGLGLEGEAPSPSFALVIPYAPPAVRLPVWHVDLYRLESADDAEELGLDDALSDSALLIEWPERLGGQLWPDYLWLHLQGAGGPTRSLTWQPAGAWKGRWHPESGNPDTLAP